MYAFSFGKSLSYVEQCKCQYKSAFTKEPNEIIVMPIDVKWMTDTTVSWVWNKFDKSHPQIKLCIIISTTICRIKWWVIHTCIIVDKYKYSYTNQSMTKWGYEFICKVDM